MTLQQLKYVIEVADKGSINEAAKSLFISQPSLSNSIKQLEYEIERKIFNRTNRGICISTEGTEFIGYARQVIQQIDVLEKKYMKANPSKQQFSISTQHSELAANAFIKLVNEMGDVAYDFTFRETKTFEVIEDIKNLRSELGIVYLCNRNYSASRKMLIKMNIIFRELYVTDPYVFVYKKHPLANSTSIKLEELQEYPCISFDQGQHHNSSYFFEEIINSGKVGKCINVNDRGTLVNCMTGLNAFLITSKVYLGGLYRKGFLSIPLEIDEKIHVGIIMHKDINLSSIGEKYLEILKGITMHI